MILEGHDIPNEFSIIQQCLYVYAFVPEKYWVQYPAHICYFNRDGLISIYDEAEWEMRDMISSYPFDLNLFNENTNYVRDRSLGKSCHRARVKIDNLLFSASTENAIELSRIRAKLCIGQDLTGFFQAK